MNSRLRALLALSVPLAYGVGLWLVMIHKIEGGHEHAEPALVGHWLRDSTLALPAVLVAVWLGFQLADGLLSRRGVSRSSGLGQGVTAAAVGLAAATAMAIGSPIHERLFEAQEAAGLPLPLHVLRDSLLALFVTFPISGIVLALLGGARLRAERKAVGGLDARRTTRATFLKAGAGGLLTVASGGALARTLSASSAQAGSSTLSLSFLITEGYVRMADGSPAWVRGFAINKGDGSPVTIPGPLIGRDPDPPDKYGEVPFVLQGDTVELTIRNTLQEAHSFVMDGVNFLVNGVLTPVVRIPSGAEQNFSFTAPSAGTYLYRDLDDVQRLLGLHGAMVVMPADGSRTSYTPSPTMLPPPFFDHQFVWVFHDVDPVWGEKARTGQPIQLETFLPRFFTINGGSGHESESSRRTSARRSVVPDGVGRKGTLIRIVNAGNAVHSPHFHGNHVYILTINGRPPLVGADGQPLALEKDVFSMQPLVRKDVLLPFHEPLDQWPPYEPSSSPDFHYPMHCHAEMSQTAGGGQYPNGMYTEWFLNGPLGEPAPVGG